jgi:hypothetical protein
VTAKAPNPLLVGDTASLIQPDPKPRVGSVGGEVILRARAARFLEGQVADLIQKARAGCLKPGQERGRALAGDARPREAVDCALEIALINAATYATMKIAWREAIGALASDPGDVAVVPRAGALRGRHSGLRASISCSINVTAGAAEK